MNMVVIILFMIIFIGGIIYVIVNPIVEVEKYKALNETTEYYFEEECGDPIQKI